MRLKTGFSVKFHKVCRVSIGVPDFYPGMYFPYSSFLFKHFFVMSFKIYFLPITDYISDNCIIVNVLQCYRYCYKPYYTTLTLQAL